jgi:hypothetical protein
MAKLSLKHLSSVRSLPEYLSLTGMSDKYNLFERRLLMFWATGTNVVTRKSYFNDHPLYGRWTAPMERYMISFILQSQPCYQQCVDPMPQSLIPYLGYSLGSLYQKYKSKCLWGDIVQPIQRPAHLNNLNLDTLSAKGIFLSYLPLFNEQNFSFLFFG